MELSSHASKRLQQRGIPPIVLRWLMDYGAAVRTHGATKRYFDKDARRRLAQDIGAQVVDRLGDLLNVYVVEADEQVITVGHRTQRIRH